MPKALSEMQRVEATTESEPKYVKVVVFDDQNRVLAVRSRNRFVLPGGRVEWDDDDAEAAARREVFESANIALGLVKPVRVIETKNCQTQSARTIVFVGRMVGEGGISEQRFNSRFMSKKTFFETIGGQSPLVRSLVESAHRALLSEEIGYERDETTMTGREKYNLHSLI